MSHHLSIERVFVPAHEERAGVSERMFGQRAARHPPPNMCSIGTWSYIRSLAWSWANVCSVGGRGRGCPPLGRPHRALDHLRVSAKFPICVTLTLSPFPSTVVPCPNHVFLTSTANAIRLRAQRPLLGGGNPVSAAKPRKAPRAKCADGQRVGARQA